MDSLREKDSNRFHGLLLLFIIVYTVWWIAKKIIKQQFGYIKAILDFVHGYCVIIHSMHAAKDTRFIHSKHIATLFRQQSANSMSTHR